MARDTTTLRSVPASIRAEGSPGPERSRDVLRVGLLGLAALTIAGIGADLAVERHWSQPIQLVPWASLAVLAAAIVLLLRLHTRGSVHIARAAAVLVILASVIGVWQHVAANYAAGPLDIQYSNVWANLSELTRWWLAVTKSIGVAPPFAPGALAESAICVLLATVDDSALALGLPNGVPVLARSTWRRTVSVDQRRRASLRYRADT
jgi:hypothetical protein